MITVSSLLGQIVSEILSAVNFNNLVAITGAERHTEVFAILFNIWRES